VWSNGFQILNLVKLGQWIMKEMTDRQLLQRCTDLGQSDFTSFPLLRTIILARDLQVTTSRKQLLREGCNRRAQNSTRHELTNQSNDWTNAFILVRTMLKNKVISIRSTCYLSCSKPQYIHYVHYNKCVANLYLGCPRYSAIRRQCQNVKRIY
jgi:hypothetical protein